MDPANAITDGHTKSDQENNDDAIFNDSYLENSFDKTQIENMDVDDQNYSAENKATGFDESLRTDEDAEDQNQNSMMTLQNKGSDTTVKHADESEEQSEQPIQKSENQPKTPEWGDVDDIFKSITKELETTEIDNESKLMSQEENDYLIKRQEREDPVTKGHGETICKTMIEANADDNLTTLQASIAAKGTDSSNGKADELPHDMDSVDQHQKSMRALQNETSCTTVQCTDRLEVQIELPVQKSENQPKTPDWGEVDEIFNGISQERMDYLTTVQPSTAAEGTDHSNSKTDEEDQVSTAVDIKTQVDDESNKNKITMNSRHDVDKTLVSDKAVERRSRTIFDPLPNDEQQSKSNDRKSEAEVKTDEIHKTKNQKKDSQDNKQKPLEKRPSEVVKKNEFENDIAVESISSDGDNNRGIINESQEKDGDGASDVKVHNGEAEGKQQNWRIGNPSAKKESSILQHSESTEDLESIIDQKKIEQQEKEVKKLEEQKVIDASKMSANRDDNSKIATSNELPDQSSMGDSIDAGKAVESNDGHAKSNKEDEVNDDKEPVNHCSCFSFLPKRKKSNQIAKGSAKRPKAKSKATEIEEKDSSNDREKIEQQGKEEKKVTLKQKQKVTHVSKMSAHKDDDSKSGTSANIPDQPKQTKDTTDDTKVEESNDVKMAKKKNKKSKKINKEKGTTDVPKANKKKTKRKQKEK